MKCPVCLKIDSITVSLADGLDAIICQRCEGHWIPRKNYDLWLKQHGDRLPAITPEPGTELNPEAPAPVKICPGCQKLLHKMPVGKGLPIHVDHCRGCGGFWLDPGEWNALAAHQLHDELHFIISPQWQRSVRLEKARQLRRQNFAKRFGADWTWICSLRKRIDDHPQAAEIRSFLASDDPLATMN